MIFMTGGNSGIGYQALIRILYEGHKLCIPCRSTSRSNELVERLRGERVLSLIDIERYLSTPIADLSDLGEIKSLINELIGNGNAFDVIALNAGLQYTGSKEPRITKQGIELTFAVNHLSHQYILQGLLPLLIKSKSARVIITSSEVHNPKTSGGAIGDPAGINNLSGLKSKQFTMINGQAFFSADKAYKDSKLCNILMAREFSRRLSILNREIPVIAWAPGLVIPYSNKGFFRYSRKYNAIGQRLFAFFARDVLGITESTENAGEILKQLILSQKYNEPGFSYFSNNIVGYRKKKFDNASTSLEASDMNLSKKLWDLSSELIGISKELKL